MISTFLLNVKAEFLKVKNSAAFWLTISGAAFIPIINVFKCLARPEYFSPKVRINPWGVLLDYNWQIAAGFFLIMYILLVSSLIVQIEYRNGTWKQVYTSPRSYADIFFSKFFVLHSLVVICFALFNLFIISSGLFISSINKEYSFALGQVQWQSIFTITAKMYCSILALLTIQYFLSLQFRNFIAPLGIGLALFTTGFMIRQWEHISYYPYLYPFLIYFPNPGLPPETARQALMNSAVWAMLFLLVGYVSMRARKEKG